MCCSILVVFFFFWMCAMFFFLVVTLMSASPIPINTNEVGAWEAQVHYFGCLLIECLANFILNIQLPPCTCTWGPKRASTTKINQGHAHNYSPVKLSVPINSYSRSHCCSCGFRFFLLAYIFMVHLQRALFHIPSYFPSIRFRTSFSSLFRRSSTGTGCRK